MMNRFLQKLIDKITRKAETDKPLSDSSDRINAQNASFSVKQAKAPASVVDIVTKPAKDPSPAVDIPSKPEYTIPPVTDTTVKPADIIPPVADISVKPAGNVSTAIDTIADKTDDLSSFVDVIKKVTDKKTTAIDTTKPTYKVSAASETSAKYAKVPFTAAETVTKPEKKSSPANTSAQISPTPQATGRRRVEIKRPETSSNVYVGLDFGTAFTKVAYEIAPSTSHKKYSVKFHNTGKLDDYLIPSILYFNPDRTQLSVKKRAEIDIELNYFKYTMISDTLPKNKELNSDRYRTANNKERLCSAFYLGYILSLVKNTIRVNPVARNVNANSRWYVTMGIPIESLTEEIHIEIYKEVLNVAWEFSIKRPNTTSIDLSEFDTFYSQNRGITSEYLNVYPELYAEVLLYQQDPNIPDGFYSVIDIGGGTADIATFFKYKPTNSMPLVECLSKKIVGLGFDSLTETVTSSEREEVLEQVRRLLDDDSFDFNNKNLSNLPDDREINKEKLLDCRKGFRTAYGTCVMSAKGIRPEQMSSNYWNRNTMKYFPLGGAGNVSFYSQAITHMASVQKNADIPTAQKDNILRYMRNNVTFEVKSDRLLISQMLAQPFDDIPPIINMSWMLPETTLKNKGKTPEELRELQDELYPK